MKPSNPVRRHDLVSTARHCPVTSAPNSTVKIGARLASIIAPLLILPAGGATITFIGGNTTWTDNANTANFSPADEPDADDDLVFNQPNTVSLGSNNAVLSLAMSNGISLDTNDFDLTVDGLLQLVGTGTDLTIGGSASTVSADSVTINSGADIVLDGGSLAIAEESGAGLLDLNDGGILSGQGTVNLNDLSLGSATTLFSNSGTLSATAGLVIGNPPAGTLSINAGDAVNARLDLDALAPVTSVVNVFRNQTLDINVKLNDAYSGDLNLTHNATLDMASPWSIDAGATVDVDNGFFDGPTPVTDIPASTSFIAGGAFTQTGGTITVVDPDGALQFNAPFTMTGGSLVNNGEVIFNANATIGSSANFTMPTNSSSLTVNAGVTVDTDFPGLAFPGGGTSANVVTVNSGGLLDLDLNVPFSGSLRLNGGHLRLGASFSGSSLFGSIATGASTGVSLIDSVPGNDSIRILSAITVNSGSTLQCPLAVYFSGTVPITVASGALLDLQDGMVVGHNDAVTISGEGAFQCDGIFPDYGDLVVSVANFDWDGNGADPYNTQVGGGMTITSPTIDADGAMDGDVLVYGGALVVNGPPSWIMRNRLRFEVGESASGGPDPLSTVGGTSRIHFASPGGFLFVKEGGTDGRVSAPVTFGPGTRAEIETGSKLTLDGDTVYDTCSVIGAGNFLPSSVLNTVADDTTISATSFDFDRGEWVIEAGAVLTVNVTDYDNTVTNLFDNSISIESGLVSMNSADPVFVFNTGTLTLQKTTDLSPAWVGEPFVLGSDTGTLDANLIATGGSCLFFAPVTFKSDADVDIGAGATLTFNSPVTFEPVNGSFNGEFTGAGRLSTNDAVNFNESTRLNLAGGEVDLDGVDLSGATVSVKAPVVIQAATLGTFGKVNDVDTNILDIDSLSPGATGQLSVNLDNPSGNWTLNGPGRLNLNNDNTVANLLTGVDAVLNGTVNVTGNVRSLARVNIGGTVNIGTAGQPFRLGGGNDSNDPNTIAGGTIQGPGMLGADAGKALVGFGSIHSAIDLGFGSDLLAKDGTLIVDGGISSADDIGTADTDGVLRVVPNWDAGNVDTILMQGGILEGGRIDNNATNGIRGHGNVTAKVLNQEGLLANVSGTKLIVQTAGNDNDWDGTSDDGFLEAVTGGTLEIRDIPSLPSDPLFAGTVAASGGGMVSVKGFDLDLGTASSLLLTGGTFDHVDGVSADIAGHVEIGAGTSVLRMNPASGGYTFKATSTSTILGQLHFDARDTTVEAGASVAGPGRLVNLANRALRLANLSIVNALVENRGTGELADRSAGRTDLLDFVQTSSGGLNIDLNGKPDALGSFDQMIVSGAAQLDGNLRLFKSGYVPAAGDTFTLISATGGVIGTFDNVIQPSGMPAGLSFEPVYEANSFKVKVVAADPFEDWISGFASITNPADRAKTANPDHDDLDNLGEFALDGNPASGAASGKIVGKIAPVGGANALTLTIPVRSGAILDPADPAGGELVLKKSSDAVTYRIQASDNLSSWALTVSEVTGPDATAIQAGLPSLSAGWIYRSFRSPGPVAGDPSEFMRVSISE